MFHKIFIIILNTHITVIFYFKYLPESPEYSGMPSMTGIFKIMRSEIASQKKYMIPIKQKINIFTQIKEFKYLQTQNKKSLLRI